ncbi:hypothetical protein GJ744_006753 [Endocarpon pusillum]|uniref:SnoaL-like domain-containing protein n=1 Tax=Endocarpon pusillum TaxID=364733 RepID=A0A8H7E0T0_9EURO|nr:hypothetical protein GJ744_006753 [Endocarpon pusillum]
MACFKLITSALLLVPCLTQATARVIRESPLPLARSSPYDDSRVQDHPDKKLLANIRNYFDAFARNDVAKIKELQAPEYTMTDITLGVIRAPRHAWNDFSAGFMNLISDLSVEALTLYGSSDPGSFSIMEDVVRFKLAQDPPPGAKENLPPGSKKGDVVSMIIISVIWWTEDGKMTQEFEYGRPTWKAFTTDPWDPRAEPMCGKAFHAGLKE